MSYTVVEYDLQPEHTMQAGSVLERLSLKVDPRLRNLPSFEKVHGLRLQASQDSSRENLQYMLRLHQHESLRVLQSSTMMYQHIGQTS